MSKQRAKVRVRVRWYIAEKKYFGPVELMVLRPAKEYVSEEVGHPVEVMLSIAERASRAKEGDYFEVTVETPGLVETMGESPRYRGQRLLFPRPARLVRVGVLTIDKVGGEAEYARVPLDDFEWYNVEEELYVFEGTLQAGDDVVLVYIETEEGPRMIIPQGREKRLRDALSPPQEEQQSPRHGHG